MAGSSVIITRSDNHGIVKGPPTEVVLTLACVSDDTNGQIPNKALGGGLDDFVLKSVQPIPDGSTPVTSAFEIIIADENGAEVFISGSIATTGVNPIGGFNTLGFYPEIGESGTFKVVDPADHASALSVGNSKLLGVVLKFARKGTLS